MQNLRKFDQYLSSVTYDPKEVGHLSVKQLGQLFSSFHGIESKDPSVEKLRLKYIQAQPKEDVDMFKLFVSSQKSKKQKGQVLEACRLEETAHQKSSQIEYREKEITVKTRSGENVVIKNSVVPEPEISVRPRAGVLISFIVEAVSVEGGNFVSRVAENVGFSVAFSAPKSSVSVLGMQEFALNAIVALKTDAVFANMALSDKTALTGSKWIAFVSRWVNSCDWNDFWVLQTLIVVKCLRIFGSFTKGKKQNPIGARCRFDGRVLIEDRLFSYSTKGIPDNWLLPADSLARKGAEEALAYLGIVAQYYGGAPKFQDAVPRPNPKFVDVRKSITDGEALRGGNGSSVSILSANKGFSGVPTATYRDGHVFFAAIFSAVKTHGKVDVVLSSSSYIDLIIATAQDRRALLWPKEDPPLPEEKICERIKLILPLAQFPTEASKRAWCQSSPRSDVYRVLQIYPSVPVFTDLTPPKDIGAECARILDGVGTAGYTLFTKVYGPSIFEKSYVYRYGRSGSLDAILSSDPSLSFYGLYVSPKLSWGKSADLVGYPSESLYYEAILVENLYRNAYFLTPTAQFSIISNIMVVKTKGITLSDQTTDYNDRIQDYNHGYDEDDSYGDDDDENGGSGGDPPINDEGPPRDDGDYEDANDGDDQGFDEADYHAPHVEGAFVDLTPEEKEAALSAERIEQLAQIEAYRLKTIAQEKLDRAAATAMQLAIDLDKKTAFSSSSSTTSSSVPVPSSRPSRAGAHIKPALVPPIAPLSPSAASSSLSAAMPGVGRGTPPVRGVKPVPARGASQPPTGGAPPPDDGDY